MESRLRSHRLELETADARAQLQELEQKNLDLLAENRLLHREVELWASVGARLLTEAGTTLPGSQLRGILDTAYISPRLAKISSELGQLARVPSGRSSPDPARRKLFDQPAERIVPRQAQPPVPSASGPNPRITLTVDQTLFVEILHYLPTDALLAYLDLFQSATRNANTAPQATPPAEPPEPAATQVTQVTQVPTGSRDDKSSSFNSSLSLDESFPTTTTDHFPFSSPVPSPSMTDSDAEIFVVSPIGTPRNESPRPEEPR